MLCRQKIYSIRGPSENCMGTFESDSWRAQSIAARHTTYLGWQLTWALNASEWNIRDALPVEQAGQTISLQHCESEQRVVDKVFTSDNLRDWATSMVRREVLHCFLFVKTCLPRIIALSNCPGWEAHEDWKAFISVNKILVSQELDCCLSYCLCVRLPNGSFLGFPNGVGFIASGMVLVLFDSMVGHFREMGTVHWKIWVLGPLFAVAHICTGFQGPQHLDRQRIASFNCLGRSVDATRCCVSFTIYFKFSYNEDECLCQGNWCTQSTSLDNNISANWPCQSQPNERHLYSAVKFEAIRDATLKAATWQRP